MNRSRYLVAETKSVIVTQGNFLPEHLAEVSLRFQNEKFALSVMSHPFPRRLVFG